MLTRTLTRSLLSVAACAALAAGANAQDVASTQAAFKKAAQQQAAGLKADFKACSLALRASLGLVIAGLEDGSLPPAELPDALSDSFAQAFETARLDILAHVQALDAFGTVLNAELAGADPDVGAPAGLVAGAGGVVDDFHRKLQLALTNLDKSFGRDLQRTLQKARKILPETTIVTGHLFPLPLVQMADPGVDDGAIESTYYSRVPLFLAGYGDENQRNVSVLGLTSGAELDMRIYDADGNLLVTLDTSPLLGGRIFKGAGPVPEGAQEPHGNVRIEMYFNSQGWTASIGY